MQGDRVIIRTNWVLRGALSAVIALSLTGCIEGVRQTSSNDIVDRPAATSVEAQADWAWSVSGDNAVRPMQVFSLKGKTYLQMRTGQLIPAVIVDGQPVPFTIAAPYLVVQGKPARIDLLASGYRAVLMHKGPVAMPGPAILPDRVQRISANEPTAPTAHTFALADNSAATREVVRQVEVPVQAPVVASASAAHDRVWRISPDQRLLSLALQDWSRTAGVKLVWNSRVDVPITGLAEYHDGSFLVAMSRALADASGGGYRFFFSMTSTQTVTVVAIRAS
jgi:hypothetical protein